MSFERWFTRTTRKFEYILFKAALGMLILLIITQVVMTNERMRSFMSVVDQMEGIPLEQYEEEQAALSYSGIGEEELYLVLEAQTDEIIPDLKILINNRDTYNFEDYQAKIIVNAGDMIEIDGQSHDFPITVFIKEASEEITPALAKAKVVTNGTIELLGWVITD